MNTMTAQKFTHRGFTLELDHDSETVFSDVTKGDYSGSLAMAEGAGIENSDWTRSIKVPESTLDFFLECEEKYIEELGL